MEPSLFHFAAIPVARHSGRVDQQTAEKRRAIEEIFFRHLTQNQELKRRLEIVSRDQQQVLQREAELVQQLNAIDDEYAIGAQQEQQRVTELRAALTDSYRQNDTLARDNAALREQLRTLEMTVADLRHDNLSLRSATAANAVVSHRQASTSPIARQPARVSLLETTAEPRQNLPQQTSHYPLETPVEAVEVESFPVVTTSSAEATARGTEAIVQPTHSTHLVEGDDGGGDVESVSPIMRPRRDTHTPFDNTARNLETTLSFVARAAPPPPTTAPIRSAALSPVSAEESPTSSRVPSIRVPPPPSRGLSGRRLAPTSTPKVPHRAGSLGALRSPTASFVPEPPPAAQVVASTEAAAMSDAGAAARVPSPQSSSSSAAPATRSPVPIVASSPAGLRKFNFSRVSKLELVGSQALPAYLTLVERRYTVHMIAKANPSSKVPSLPPALVRGGRCAPPAHPIKMFGQHWYVFQVADHGSDLPSSVTSGSMETLPSQLLSRIQTQQYMKLSDILTLFLGVSEALQTFHQIGFAHGNVDSCNIFCPRNLNPPSEEQAPPPEGQPLLLSGFAVTPFHRNPLFRAPETTQSPEDASIASDMWALGVVFWDITNYGMAPLYDVNRDAENAIVASEIAFDKVCSGENLLRCPENCPPVVYNDLIAPLLNPDPNQRPTIETIVATIEELLHT